MAPELIERKRYSEKVDIWSLGVITYQLLSGVTPFDGRNIKDINKNIVQKKLMFVEKEWKKVSQNPKDFISKCLDRD